MNIQIMVLIFVLLVSITLYLSKRLNYKKLDKDKIISFSAGFIISYLFLKLLPELFYFKSDKPQNIYLLILAGFTTVHLIEKYLYQHENKTRRNTNHQKLHLIFFAIYYFILTLLINFFSTINLLSAASFTTAIIFYTIIKTLPSSATKHNNSLYIAPIIGYLFSILFNPPFYFFTPLLAIITGTMFYFSIRELVPTGKKGKPLFFVLGILSYYIIDFALLKISLSIAGIL